MRTCKRSTPDPLLRTFLETYRLNLLATPRADAAVGDLYVETKGRTSSPGSLQHFLTPGFALAETTRDAPMAQVAGAITDAISLRIGLGLLEGFLAALGALGVVDEVKGAYSREGAHALRFSFSDARRDAVDAGWIGAQLIRQQFTPSHALVNPGNRYYLVTGVAKSASLSVGATSKSGRQIELAADVLKAVEAEGKITVSKEREGTYAYAGDTPLAFGVELYELAHDPRANKIKMAIPDGAIRLLAAGERARPVLEPAFIGTADDDALIDVARVSVGD